MNKWPKDELRKIAESDDLHISPFHEDGVTYGTPTWTWSVAVGDALAAQHGSQYDPRPVFDYITRALAGP
jgi:hypothetical protein